MNTSGGFLLDPSQSEQAGPPSAIPDLRDDEEEGSVTARKLSAKQELRLMNYLDEEFLQINRGFNKRHNSKSSSVPRLNSFLQAYGAILEVIASIPPIGPSVSLLVSYLLRLTSELLDGILGYEVSTKVAQVTHNEENEDDEENNQSIDVPLLTEQLENVIQCLSLLDKVWSTVLKGQLIDIKAAKINVNKDFKESDDYFPVSKEGHRNGLEENHSKIDTVSGRYSSSSSKVHHIKETKSIIGSKGFSSVAQTDRIRLRNVIMLGKENLFAWMRIQLDVPLPPQIGTDEEDNKVDEIVENKETVKEDTKVEEKGSDGEQDLEEVDTDRRGQDIGIDEVLKREDGGDRHFDHLFARKIDPDASDSDSDSKSASDSDPNEQPSSKRLKRTERSESRQQSFSVPSNDVESVATFSNTATVMKWDIKFARLFANTLRCLSDIQEYRNQREANQRSTDQEGDKE